MEPGGEAITWVLANILPGPLGVLMTLALLSAILSSADTCLVTASAIISRQFWKGGEVLPVRVLMLVLGTGAFATAWLKADIVKTLLLSYSVFNCGMIAPMLAAIMLYPRRKLAVRFVIPAIISGGTIGLWANFTDHKQMISIAAFGVSALLTAGAAMKGKKLQTGIFNDENR
jgi:SSS family solute:Na+ symporter